MLKKISSVSSAFFNSKKPVPASVGYNEEILFYLKEFSLANHISTIIDAGAYVGDFSVACASIFPQAIIYAIEPAKKAFRELEKKTSPNLNIKPLNVALSDWNGQANLNINVFKETNSILESNETHSSVDKQIKTIEKETVAVITLDALCNREEIKSIDILKIDVQGASYNVLKGASGVLQNSNIKLLIVEADFLEIYKNEKLYHHIGCYLEEFGYELYTMFNLHYDINKRLSWADAIFIKK